MKAKTIPHSVGINERGTVDIFQCVTGLYSAHVTVSLIYKDACLIHNGTLKKFSGNAI